VTPRPGRRPALLLGVVAAVLVAGPVGPAAAAGRPSALGVSVDGRSWSSDLGQPLFDPSAVWVPGDVHTASFSVRNQTVDGGRLSLRVDASDPQSLLGAPDLTLSARVAGGDWVALPDDRAFHELAGVLGAGRVARVDLRASFDAASPDSSQLKALAIRFRALLVRDVAVSGGPAHAAPGVPGLLAFTGAPLRGMVGAGLVLLTLGCLLVRLRSRSRRPATCRRPRRLPLLRRSPVAPAQPVLLDPSPCGS
jgi:hypothetical protein